MRILLLNQNFFKEEFRYLGHDVLSVGLLTNQKADLVLAQQVVQLDELLDMLPPGFEPDIIVWLDDSAPIRLLGFEDCDIPCVFYSIDSHHHHLVHSHAAGMFDHVLVAQKDFLINFNVHDTPVTWLPLWASEYMNLSADKKYGAVFVGTLDLSLNPARVRFFDRLKHLVPIEVMTGHFPSIFPHAEIVVNQTVSGDLNFRVFESMMSGALLLTEKTGNGLFDLFEDNIHFVTYTPDNATEAAAKISSLLSDPLKMRAIAAKGREEIMQAHLAIHRAKELDIILRDLKKRPRYPRRHYAALANLSYLYEVAKNANPLLRQKALASALQSARAALFEGAKPSDLEAGLVIRTCLGYDHAFKEHLGMEMLCAYEEAFPEMLYFALVKIGMLLSSSQKEEAIQCAGALNLAASCSDILKLAEDMALSLGPEADIF